MAALMIPGHPKPRPREVTLEEVRACVGDCHLCPLGQTRTNLVFGVGNPHARVMFVGEGPGRDRKSTRLNSSHPTTSRMPSSA